MSADLAIEPETQARRPESGGFAALPEARALGAGGERERGSGIVYQGPRQLWRTAAGGTAAPAQSSVLESTLARLGNWPLLPWLPGVLAVSLLPLLLRYRSRRARAAARPAARAETLFAGHARGHGQPGAHELIPMYGRPGAYLAQGDDDESIGRDILTGLAGRSMLDARMARASAGRRAGESRAQLLVMGLDGFRRINEAHGHHVGDVILRSAAKRLSAVVRQTDLLARIGGDMFVLFIDDLPVERAGSEFVARKLIRALEAPLRYSNREFAVGLSVGMSSAAGRWHPDDLLMAAGEAMCAAKKAGGNCWCHAGANGVCHG